FHNGIFNLYSDTKSTLTGTCHVNSIYIKNCGPGYTNINGFDLTTTNREAIQVLGSYGVYIYYCQSTVSIPAYTGIQVNESFCSISSCKIANRNHAASFSNSRCVSAYWDSGSVGNTAGVSSYNGSQVHLFGTQPNGINPLLQGTGGAFFYENGTQIRNMVNTGLSCTWGTISGGYIRHGNMAGAAMVTIQISVTVSIALSQGVNYTISGLPIPASVVPVNCQVSDHFGYKAITSTGSTGQMVVQPVANIQIGNTYHFNVTYLTIV
ncbi:hypothetical protein, partial [Lacrimispora amygdalina]|uniref:hypothetical protein n=1 Tax=Lacrimispora amygdalina TaxID=253257 RepID=UPI0031F92B2E